MGERYLSSWRSYGFLCCATIDNMVVGTIGSLLDAEGVQLLVMGLIGSLYHPLGMISWRRHSWRDSLNDPLESCKDKCCISIAPTDLSWVSFIWSLWEFLPPLVGPYLAPRINDVARGNSAKRPRRDSSCWQGQHVLMLTKSLEEHACVTHPKQRFILFSLCFAWSEISVENANAWSTP